SVLEVLPVRAGAQGAGAGERAARSSRCYRGYGARLAGLLPLRRIGSVERLQIAKIGKVGTAVQRVHLVGRVVRDVSALGAVQDAVLDLGQRRARGVEVWFLRPVLVLRESFGLVAADRGDRVAEVARELEVFPRARVILGVFDDQPPQCVREL